MARLHTMHDIFNVCTRCGLTGDECADRDCLTDQQIEERRQWLKQAGIAAEVFDRGRKRG